MVGSLADLVDKDFDDWWRSHMIWLVFVSLAGLGFLSLLLVFSSIQYPQPISLGLFSAGIAVLAISLSFCFGWISILEGFLMDDRFRRISKSLRLKRLDSERNKLILWSLILIRENLPIKLSETMTAVPTLFEEENLLRYATRIDGDHSVVEKAKNDKG